MIRWVLTALAWWAGVSLTLGLLWAATATISTYIANHYSSEEDNE